MKNFIGFLIGFLATTIAGIIAIACHTDNFTTVAVGGFFGVVCGMIYGATPLNKEESPAKMIYGIIFGIIILALTAIF